MPQTNSERVKFPFAPAESWVTEDGVLCIVGGDAAKTEPVKATRLSRSMPQTITRVTSTLMRVDMEAPHFTSIRPRRAHVQGTDPTNVPPRPSTQHEVVQKRNGGIRVR